MDEIPENLKLVAQGLSILCVLFVVITYVTASVAVFTGDSSWSNWAVVNLAATLATGIAAGLFWAGWHDEQLTLERRLESQRKSTMAQEKEPGDPGYWDE